LQQNRVPGGEAVELVADVVNHKQIAVGTIRVTQPQVQAPGIQVDGVQLHQCRSRHKAVERVARAAGAHLDVVNLVVQLETVPLRRGENAEVRVGMVSPAEAKFIQGAVIVGAESFKHCVHEGLAGVGAPGELMPVKMIDAGRNEHIAEDVERRVQPLNEVVEQVVIGVGAVMKQGSEGGLPLLCLQNTLGIRLVAKKSPQNCTRGPVRSWGAARASGRQNW